MLDCDSRELVYVCAGVLVNLMSDASRRSIFKSENGVLRCVLNTGVEKATLAVTITLTLPETFDAFTFYLLCLIILESSHLVERSCQKSQLILTPPCNTVCLSRTAPPGNVIGGQPPHDTPFILLWCFLLAILVSGNLLMCPYYSCVLFTHSITPKFIPFPFSAIFYRSYTFRTIIKLLFFYF